jgi:hypothetical protein
MTMRKASYTKRAPIAENGNVARGCSDGKRLNARIAKTGIWRFLSLTRAEVCVLDDLTLNELENNLGGWG